VFLIYFRYNKKVYIPKVLFQTYFDKSKVPSKVYDNINKFASDYKHVMLDDNDAIVFLKNHYPQYVTNAFRSFKKGAHKADLLRYCLLYKYGGVYLDIKTELLSSLSSIFKHNKNLLFAVLSKNKKSIYTGILASPPKNPIFKILIHHCVTTNPDNNYHIFVNYFYNQLGEICHGPVKSGYNKAITKPDFYLFNERCTDNKNDCYDGLDRYGLCCNVYDFDRLIIKTRYSDFPWN
tara:strand:+ start:285 stop:989 length:705 start_codon:yes stop_codon:yes gene_type:complete